MFYMVENIAKDQKHFDVLETSRQQIHFPWFGWV